MAKSKGKVELQVSVLHIFVKIAKLKFYCGFQNSALNFKEACVQMLCMNLKKSFISFREILLTELPLDFKIK